MGEVIDIEKAKLAKMPHIIGEAYCIVCKNKWTAICPSGVVWLECPDCRSMKGLLKYPCSRQGPVWICECSNYLFEVTPEGILCPNCGGWQKGY